MLSLLVRSSDNYGKRKEKLGDFLYISLIDFAKLLWPSEL